MPIDNQKFYSLNKLKIHQITNTNSLLLLICLQHCLHYAPYNGAATISHDEFVSINNALRKNNELKEEIKNLKV